MKKFITLVLVSVFALCGCIKDMDPFQGGDGVRVNVNGRKCVMVGVLGGRYAQLNNTGDTGECSTTISMMSAMPDNMMFDLAFAIKENEPLVINKEYKVGSGNSTVGMTGFSVGASQESRIPLQGWVKFISLGTTIQARFELDGKGEDGTGYALRHGFLRLKQKEERQ